VRKNIFLRIKRTTNQAACKVEFGYDLTETQC
jgi:hypothetical protein